MARVEIAAGEEVPAAAGVGEACPGGTPTAAELTLRVGGECCDESLAGAIIFTTAPLVGDFLGTANVDWVVEGMITASGLSVGLAVPGGGSVLGDAAPETDEEEGVPAWSRRRGSRFWRLAGGSSSVGELEGSPLLKK